ncbi:hypothetical protein NQ314_019418 [Rhamnusium bicolor]|uniref:BTB domain-containing protein n=1 Tax=Rhamnusium bicolor TaxID=1586634 RepID=A0AAV8WNP4_9CUCU|nr:hypothetical protein NQ314_019418 [Rhamnusium bicolor]
MFKTLYKDELLTDCTLYCKDGSIKAHKLILAASSPYFRKVFLEHNDEHAIFIMHGLSVGQLQDLLELIYKGSIDVPGENLNSLFDLAEDLQVTGVLVEDSSDSKYNSYGRDTRFKGQKRVAVDFTAHDNESVPAKIVKNDTEDTPTAVEDTTDIVDRTEISTTERETFMGHPVDDQSNLSVWARKERKFKLQVWPQTTIGHVRILTPEQSMIESPEPIVQSPETASNPQKKGRGRPRKYPIESTESAGVVPNPFSGAQKRGRGRPRKYPIVPPPLIKRPRGRPRLNPIVPQDVAKRENYDISNMPYGDLEYLTKPLHENNEDMSIHEHGLMEPLVEIKTEPNEKPEPEREEHSASFLENIGLFENSAIAKIGECTISVANNGSSSST